MVMSDDNDEEYVRAKTLSYSCQITQIPAAGTSGWVARLYCWSALYADARIYNMMNWGFS